MKEHGSHAADDKEDRPRVVSASFIAAASNAKELPPPEEGLSEIAFAGRSNVGKSSLLNALLQRRNLVRTSRTPGCTRGINIFHAALDDGFSVRLVDLPGYGWARRSKSERGQWGPLLETYLEGRAVLKGVVLLVDIRRGVEPDDVQLVEFLTRLGRPVVLVATKLDKMSLSQRKPALAKLRATAGGSALGFSAVSKEGRNSLWRRIVTLSRGETTVVGSG